jgi:hypothetical protein
MKSRRKSASPARATGAPFLQGAMLFDFDGDVIQQVDYRDTTHILITRDFLNSPESFFKHQLAAPDNRGDRG